MTAAPQPHPHPVPAIRRFNRFYTRQIGLLQQGLLESSFSLTEVRLLYELAHREAATATGLAADLTLDPGYLSRMLANFEKRGWIRRQPSLTDRRQSILALTAKGSATFRPDRLRFSSAHYVSLVSLQHIQLVAVRVTEISSTGCAY